MKNEYLKLAECYESLAESYRSLAEADNNNAPWEDEAVKPKEEADVDITVVRKVLAEKTQSGKSAEVKALLLKYGANKLSAVAPENYAGLLKEAEEL